MPFQIDPKSGIPIYIQLKDSIRSSVLRSIYPPGSQLPTVRQVAVALSINANTVARAYMELEREGFISTQQGRGTFVCGLPPVLDVSKKEKQLDELLKKVLDDAYLMGFTSEEVLDTLKKKIIVGFENEKETEVDI